MGLPDRVPSAETLRRRDSAEGRMTGEGKKYLMCAPGCGGEKKGVLVELPLCCRLGQLCSLHSWLAACRVSVVSTLGILSMRDAGGRGSAACIPVPLGSSPLRLSPCIFCILQHGEHFFFSFCLGITDNCAAIFKAAFLFPCRAA